VERLRIELLRKGDDLVLVNAFLADLVCFSDLEVFPVVRRFFHYHIVITNVSVILFCFVPLNTRTDTRSPLALPAEP
jgi:hypothetical protein